MNLQEVERLQRYIGEDTRLVETHISWVLLTPKFAYKIKKPLRFSFLDFSTVEKRKRLCEREIELNSRLAPFMYLDVIPVRKVNDELHFGKGEGTNVDWAVKMRRLDESKQMDLLLRKDEVGRYRMEELAEELVAFHSKAEVVVEKPEIHRLQDDFADLENVIGFLEEEIDPGASKLVPEAIEDSARLLDQLEERIISRYEDAFYIDGHGDLHSGNIFLLDRPVIFDCIEFNDHFRRVDVLNELAFLCMDLDFYRKPRLAIVFLETYLKMFPCIFMPEDERLFVYYKWYRSNIKVKINAIKCMQAEGGQEMKRRMANSSAYYSLFRKYRRLLIEGPQAEPDFL